MIDLDSLPTDRHAVARLDLQFDRLDPDTPAGCPRSLAAVRKYLRADGAAEEIDLFFGRTAAVGRMRFWLWAYTRDAQTFYVAVETFGDEVAIASGLRDGLTPEQYLGLRYARTLRERATFGRRGAP